MANTAVSLYDAAYAADAYRRTYELKPQPQVEAARPAAVSAAEKRTAADMSAERTDAAARGSVAGGVTGLERDQSLARAAFDGAKNNEVKLRTEKQLGVRACETCASRQYVDESGDAGVSFKSPGHISPEASMSVVSAHEQEHVRIAKAEAAAEDKKIVSQHVQLHMDRCPECGKSYVSGGTTTTTMRTQPGSEKSEIAAVGGSAGGTGGTGGTGGAESNIRYLTGATASARKELLDRAYNTPAVRVKNMPGQILDIAA